MDELLLIGAFKQGAAGNCASISVIKLAIAKYGLDNVFTNVDSDANGYRITMRDGTALSISHSELDVMKTLDFFVNLNNTNVYNYAKFLYAVMAKHKQILENISTIEKAATYKSFLGLKTNHLLSMDTEDNLKYLGLSGLYRNINKNDISNHEQLIITSVKHSAFASNGMYDDYGDPTLFSEFSRNYGSINEDYNYILV